MGSVGKRGSARGKLLVGTLALGAGSAAAVGGAAAQAQAPRPSAPLSTTDAAPTRAESAYGLTVVGNGDGAVVGRVVPGSVAAERGIRPGNEILSVHGIQVAGGDGLGRAIAAAASEGRSAALVQLRTDTGWRLVTLPVATA